MEQPVKFNNKEIPSFVRVTGRTTSVLPPVSLVSQEVPRTIGRIHSRVKVEPREYKLDIVIEQDGQWDLDNKMDILGDWLRGDSFAPSPLTFKEQPDRFVLAVVSGSTDINDLFVAGEGSITFTADNPVKSLYETDKVEGYGSITVDYKGTVEHRPLIELSLTKDCSKIEFKSDKDSKVIILHGQFKSGQKVTVDSQRKLIKLDGIVNMRLLDLSSDWFHLKEGKNRITVLIDGKAMPEIDMENRNYFRLTTPLVAKTNVGSVARTADTPNGFTFTGTQNIPRGLRIPTVIDSNGYWTVSGYLRGTQSTVIEMFVDINDLGATKVTSGTDNAWTYFEVTVNVTNYSEPTYTFVDFDSLQWKVYMIKDFKVEKGKKATPWTPAPEDSALITDNLKNKTAGSNLENPNNVKYTYQTSVVAPSKFTAELVNGANNAFNAYESIMALDGSTIRLTNDANGYISQSMISWNLLEIVTRKYPELKGITVANLKQELKQVSVNVWARGSSSLGNKAYYKLWVNGNEWGGTVTNNSSALSKMSYVGSTPSIINAYITNEGYIHALLHADSSDGTIASSLSVDYANIEISLDIFSKTMPITVTHSTAFY